MKKIIERGYITDNLMSTGSSSMLCVNILELEIKKCYSNSGGVYSFDSLISVCLITVRRAPIFCWIGVYP